MAVLSQPPPIRRRRVALVLSLAALFSIPSQAQPRDASGTCQPAAVSRLTGLSEASGLAVSARVPGRFWTHNDAGKPVLVGIDARGTTTQRVELTGVAASDWEAVAVGPCPSGSCVYVADIGDNAARRKSIAVYRLAEPAAGSQSVAVTDVFHATYPDGAQDAEALLVTPDARLYIVTKGDSGPVALYRFPAALRAGATATLERVGKAIHSGKPADTRITDGSVSPDGRWTVLRSRASLVFYRTDEFVAGNFREVKRVDLKAAGEAQGEGVAIGADHVVYLVGEGGSKGQPGTFTHLRCELK
jgi:hypothetical protein